MDLLPETKLLIEVFGDANYALGTCDRADAPAQILALAAAKSALIEHLETNYTPTPQA